MKNRWAAVLIAVTVLFVGFLSGFFVGRMTGGRPAALSVQVTGDPDPSEHTALPAVTPPVTTPPETTAPETAQPAPPASAPPVQPGKVNVNTADLDQLMTLPGIGPVLGQAIIDYREENGPFSCLEDLTQVKGIGTKRLEAILEYATVGGAE